MAAPGSVYGNRSICSMRTTSEQRMQSAGEGRRPLRKDFQSSTSCRGGRLCPPAGYTGFAGIFGGFAASSWADVGIGPYRTCANSHNLANFERRAFLQQSFKDNCYQSWCPVTGGAYHSARKVSLCVRSDYKMGSCLNCTRRTHQTRPGTLFFHIFSLAREKIWLPEARCKRFAGLRFGAWASTEKSNPRNIANRTRPLAAPGVLRYTIRQQDSQSSFLGNLLWSYSMWFFS